MPFWPGRKALSVLVVALLVFAALPGRAGPLAAPDEAAIQLDQQIQALKDEVLEFNRRAQQTEDDVLFPAHSRMSVYLGVRVSGLLLKEISVSINERPAETYVYGDRDAKALLRKDHLQRLLRANIAPGAHRIRVAFTAQWADADADDPPLSDVYEAIFDKGQTEAELEFTIARESRVAKPRLSMKQWRPAKT